jgi:hypothetical protein
MLSMLRWWQQKKQNGSAPRPRLAVHNISQCSLSQRAFVQFRENLFGPR